jgi:hypothetical protein
MLGSPRTTISVTKLDGVHVVCQTELFSCETARTSNRLGSSLLRMDAMCLLCAFLSRAQIPTVIFPAGLTSLPLQVIAFPSQPLLPGIILVQLKLSYHPESCTIDPASSARPRAEKSDVQLLEHQFKKKSCAFDVMASASLVIKLCSLPARARTRPRRSDRG